MLRVAAYVIDSIVLALLVLVLIEISVVEMTAEGVLPAPADGGSMLALLITQSIYNIGFTAAWAATPGKMAMRIVIRGRDGEVLEPDAAILRYIVLMVGNLVFVGLVASLVLLFVDKQRRTLHDRVAKTLVVKVTSIAETGAV